MTDPAMRGLESFPALPWLYLPGEGICAPYSCRACSDELRSTSNHVSQPAPLRPSSLIGPLSQIANCKLQMRPAPARVNFSKRLTHAGR
jgi:hypothetical protein